MKPPQMQSTINSSRFPKERSLFLKSILAVCATSCLALCVCAQTSIPAEDVAVIEAKLKVLPSNNPYLDLFKETRDIVFEKEDSKLLKNYRIYLCRLLDPGLEELGFMFAADDKLAHFWILTGDADVLSELYKNEKLFPLKQTDDVIRLAIEACKLTRSFNIYYFPLDTKKEFDTLIDTSKAKTVFKPFSLKKTNDNSYEVSGFLLIRRDLVLRTITLTDAKISFDDKVIEEGVGRFQSVH
jgi:hypothetical protein